MEKKTKNIIWVTIAVILVVFLVMFFLKRGICIGCSSHMENVENINSQTKGEIDDLFVENTTTLVISLGNQQTAKVKRGTDNFGIPMGFTPTNSEAWGTVKPYTGCTYTIEADKTKSIDSCLNKGWTNPLNSIITGTKNVAFDAFQNNTGYSLIKIDIPKDVQPCLQRFKVTVNCAGYPNETVSDNFDIQIIKKNCI